MKLFVMMATASLGSCAGNIQENLDTQLIQRKCPPLVSYSKEQREKAIEELKKVATDAQIAKMIADYSKLRDACRIK